jgi:hypothetical protein
MKNSNDTIGNRNRDLPVSVNLQMLSPSYITALYPLSHFSCPATVNLQMPSPSYIAALYPLSHFSCPATVNLQMPSPSYITALYPLSHFSCPATVNLQMLSPSYITALYPLPHFSCPATVNLQMLSPSYITALCPLSHFSCPATVNLQTPSPSYITALYPLSHFSCPATLQYSGFLPTVNCSCTTTVTGPCVQSVGPLSQRGWACVLLHKAIHAQSPTQNGRKRSLLSSITFYIARGLMSRDLVVFDDSHFHYTKILTRRAPNNLERAGTAFRLKHKKKVKSFRLTQLHQN